MESQEFLKVTQFLEFDFRRTASRVPSGNPLQSSEKKSQLQFKPGTRVGHENESPVPSDTHEFGFIHNGADHPSKRAYRVWTSWERYTVCLGIATYGGIKRDSITKIQALLEGRSCSQVTENLFKL
jgi:hypothetical protein